MMSQPGLDLVSGMRGKLQQRGVSFSRAMTVPAAELRRAAEDPRAFERLVRTLTPKSKRNPPAGLAMLPEQIDPTPNEGVAALLYEMFLTDETAPEWAALGDGERRIWLLRSSSVMNELACQRELDAAAPPTGPVNPGSASNTDESKNNV
jgi:hypothetical protein